MSNLNIKTINGFPWECRRWSSVFCSFVFHEWVIKTSGILRISHLLLKWQEFISYKCVRHAWNTYQAYVKPIKQHSKWPNFVFTCTVLFCVYIYLLKYRSGRIVWVQSKLPDTARYRERAKLVQLLEGANSALQCSHKAHTESVPKS